MSATDARPFDVHGELPNGIAVLEASAGTGKTFTISALAARYVAAGTPLDQLLIVTFTRMATGELRDRVRARLVSAERALADVALGGPVPADDEVAVHLATGSAEEVELRRSRLARAVADFDAATITTTHGFCREALAGLGFAGEVERGVRFAEDLRDLVDQVAGDRYVQDFHRAPDDDPDTEWPPFPFEQARKIAREAVANPDAPIVPQGADDGSGVARRVAFAEAVRVEFERRKRAAAVMSFDDLLVRLQVALEGPGGNEVAARLRRHYRVVLVDEFQDTDPIQWSIMQRAFDHEDATLVLIGDPKQAIYAFRGADVHAYLKAARSAVARHTLTTNWRSDEPLLRACAALLRHARLGHDEIVVRDVDAAPGHRLPRLQGAPDPAPMRIRVASREATGITKRGGHAKKDEARTLIARDLAQDVVRMLHSGATIDDEQDGPTRLRPGHLAVLVRRNADAACVHEALLAAGVPAVLGSADSVFGTPAAQQWLTLLEAVDQPGAPTRARAAALTPFIGWSAEAVGTADDDTWEDLHTRLHEWADVLRTAGVAALLETISTEQSLPERVLARPGGERALTDLRHIGRQLHAAATAEHLGPAALLAWLRRSIADAQDDADEERSRRLESDAEAVQVLTVHRSKGLEFPIVYLPYLWDPSLPPKGRAYPITFHDPENDHRRALDVSCEKPADGPDVVVERQTTERRGEDLRLAYVALTRARHQVVLWWAGVEAARDSALSRLAFHQAADGTMPERGEKTPADDDALERFAALAPGRPDLVSVELASEPGSVTWLAEASTARELEAATFDRGIDYRWRRTSFSAIVAAAHEAPGPAEGGAVGLLVQDEPVGTDDGVGTDAVPGDGALRVVGGAAGDADAGPTGVDGPGPVGDAEATTDGPPTTPTDPLDAPSPMADLPAGRHFGTLVHDVFEAADFAADDLDAELRTRVADAIARRRLDVGDPERLVVVLQSVLHTPLGPTVDDLALRALPRTDRLDELAFELPLVGGRTPHGHLDTRAIAALLREHLPDGDPLHAYAERLDDPLLAGALRGHLTGSIDLVLRTHAPDGKVRYAVVDYKTNRLGRAGGTATLRDYAPAALTAAMHDAHYGLQGLLYLVALHRYLRWRLPGYDPDEDLAGLLYLFLRGMRGSDTTRVDAIPTGVFAWRPPGALVAALSDLLDEGVTG